MTENFQALEKQAARSSKDWKPYPAYKDSGTPWLGRVPAHWEVRRAKYLLREIDDRSQQGDERLLSVSQYTGVTPRRSIEGREEQHTRANSLVGYKKVAVDDLVINIMLAWNGSTGVSSYGGVVSPAYCVYRFAPGLVPRYFHNLLRSPLYRDHIKTASRGVVESRLRLYTDDLGGIEATLPPPSEQAAIVRFLDYQDRLISRYIRAKLKLIALLTEQKQAIIQRAVTRGLDPGAKLKPSGVDWMGKMPAHWDLRRNSSLFAERKQAGDPATPMLVVSLRTGVTVAGTTDHFGKPRKEIADKTAYSAVRKGDLAYNTMRMWQGAVGVVPVDGRVSPAYVVLAPRHGHDSAYFALLFRTPQYMSEVNRQSTGIVSDRNRLYWDDFKAMSSPCPPVEEQTAVVSSVRSSTAVLDSAVARAERQIALMREYRTRLIADVVTGKVDVREAAVPELPEADEAPDAGPAAEQDGEEEA